MNLKFLECFLIITILKKKVNKHYNCIMSEFLYKEIWQETLKEIHNDFKNNNQENQFLLWYNLEYIEDTIDSITVGVSSDFMWKKTVDKGIPEQICNKIKNLTGQPELKLIPKIQNIQISQENNQPTEINTNSEKQKDIQNIQIKKNNQNLEKIKSDNRKNSSLNPEFTFENFITNEGSANHFAYSMAKSVAENPGIKNPILFYGGVGLGKTHLMQAIGNKIIELSNNSKKICYTQTEFFLNEFTMSIMNKTQNSFKNKYRNVDVLLLDDIQFLSNKDGVQEELFYTFEALYGNKKQMVFTCDRPLIEIKNIAERLVSRLGSGMCLNLNMPDYETRKAIIYKKLEKFNIPVSEEIIDFVSKVVETNIRDIEGAITNIVGYQEFLGNTPITVEQAKELIKDYYKAPSSGNISIENIKKVIAEDFNISVKDLIGSKRTNLISYARHIAFYITRNLTELSLSDIGNEFGGRDHSSVINGIKKIEDKIKIDSLLNQKIQQIIKEIKEYKN